MTWTEYEQDLERQLVELQSRVHRGTYRIQPSRRVYIPKADGRQRTLGIAALEDKIVQQAVVSLLGTDLRRRFSGIFVRVSAGARAAYGAGRAECGHRADAGELDADIRGFYDNVNHEWVMKFVPHRVADQRILRLIHKWLRAGVSEDSQWSETEVGTPQGAVVSPLIANVYLHCLDGSSRRGETFDSF